MNHGNIALPESVRGQLFHVAYLVTGDREIALELTDRALDTAMAENTTDDPIRVALIRLLRSFEKISPKRWTTIDVLDRVLRSEVTRPLDPRNTVLHSSRVQGMPLERRIQVLTWELKRTCLVATLGCLSTSLRVSFVLTDLLRYEPVHAAALLGIEESAYRARLLRARVRLREYLEPRCSRLTAENPCSCPSRVAAALDSGFLRFPVHDLDTPDGEIMNESPANTVARLYSLLHQVHPHRCRPLCATGATPISSYNPRGEKRKPDDSDVRGP